MEEVNEWIRWIRQEPVKHVLVCVWGGGGEVAIENFSKLRETMQNSQSNEAMN